MDKLIYAAFNTVNNIYDNRSVRAQNLPTLRCRATGVILALNLLEPLLKTLTHCRAVRWRFRMTPIISAPNWVPSETGGYRHRHQGRRLLIVQGLGQPSVPARGSGVNAEGILENGTSQKMLDADCSPFSAGAPCDQGFEDGDVIIEPLLDPEPNSCGEARHDLAEGGIEQVRRW